MNVRIGKKYALCACVGKVAFDSFKSAARGARGHREMEPYRCRQCGNWHVGPRTSRGNQLRLKARKLSARITELEYS